MSCLLPSSFPPHFLHAHSLHFFFGLSLQKSQSGLLVPRDMRHWIHILMLSFIWVKSGEIIPRPLLILLLSSSYLCFFSPPPPLSSSSNSWITHLSFSFVLLPPLSSWISFNISAFHVIWGYQMCLTFLRAHAFWAWVCYLVELGAGFLNSKHFPPEINLAFLHGGKISTESKKSEDKIKINVEVKYNLNCRVILRSRNLTIFLQVHPKHFGWNSGWKKYTRVCSTSSNDSPKEEGCLELFDGPCAPLGSDHCVVPVASCGSIVHVVVDHHLIPDVHLLQLDDVAGARADIATENFVWWVLFETRKGNIEHFSILCNAL